MARQGVLVEPYPRLKLRQVPGLLTKLREY